MSFKSLFKRKYFYIIGALFLTLLFAYITYKTPLAGDDWGYALNGLNNNPITTAINFYYGWSGRFFSELWGFIAAPHKIIWNIVNPLCFCLIFLAIYKISIKRHNILNVLLIIAMMLSVDDNLRMETYSWLMGETYVIPLCLSLIYFVIVDKMMKTDFPSKKVRIAILLANILLFIIGLMMENIAAAMVFATFVLCIITFIYKRRKLPYFILNFLFSTISFIILRLSPGATYRTLNDHAAWASLSLFEKLKNGYPAFLEMSFINNNYAITLFAICLILFILHKRNAHKLFTAISLSLIQILAIFSVFSFVLIKGNNIFTNPNSLYSYIFWPVYILMTFIAIVIYSDDNYMSIKTIFLLTIGGVSALSMMYSPIYGSRSALYLVYYLILVSTLILEEISFNYKEAFILLVLLSSIIGDRSKEYLYKYHLVGLREEERQSIYDYYRDHDEVEEAWIPRFPVYTIHGADIEEGDSYHFETFKEYYQLPQDADKIIFFFKESGD